MTKPPIIVNGGGGDLHGKRNPLFVIIPLKRANSQGGYQSVVLGGGVVENKSCQAPPKTIMENDAEKAVEAFSCE